MNLENYIANIPDFPEEGIVFRDITPLFADAEAYHYAIDKIAKFGKARDADIVVGPEARGFMVGCPVAYAMNCGFVPARKAGKLPRSTYSVSYGLEYGQSTLEIHQDAIKTGQKVLIVDDLLATGGTIEATRHLIEEMGGEVVGAAFLIDLVDLKGRDKIKDLDILTLLEYEGE